MDLKCELENQESMTDCPRGVLGSDMARSMHLQYDPSTGDAASVQGLQPSFNLSHGTSTGMDMTSSDSRPQPLSGHPLIGQESDSMEQRPVRSRNRNNQQNLRGKAARRESRQASTPQNPEKVRMDSLVCGIHGLELDFNAYKSEVPAATAYSKAVPHPNSNKTPIIYGNTVPKKGCIAGRTRGATAMREAIQKGIPLPRPPHPCGNEELAAIKSSGRMFVAANPPESKHARKKWRRLAAANRPGLSQVKKEEREPAATEEQKLLKMRKEERRLAAAKLQEADQTRAAQSRGMTLAEYLSWKKTQKRMEQKRRGARAATRAAAREAKKQMDNKLREKLFVKSEEDEDMGMGMGVKEEDAMGM